MKMQKILVLFLIITVCMLGSAIWFYYEENNKPVSPQEERDELVIMSTYEEGDKRKALQKIAEQYSAIDGNPTVVFTFISQADLQKELCIDKDQNKLPDLIIYENVMTSVLESMGIVTDLTEYMATGNSAEYLLSAYNSTFSNGICYGVPFSSDPYVLFYNADYYEKYKETIPEQMQEFYEMCTRTQTLGTYSTGIAIKNKEDITSSFLQMLGASGGTIRDLESDNCIQFYEILAKMRDNEIMPQDVVSWNKNDLMKAFAEGYVKTAITELSSLSELEKCSVKFNYRVTEVPYIQKQVYLMHGDNIGVATTADYEKATKLLHYMTSKEVLKQYYEETNCLSVRVDLNINPAERLGITEDFIQKEKYQSTLKSSYASWFLISDAISENVGRFIGTRNMSISEFAKVMQEEVRNAIMER